MPFLGTTKRVSGLKLRSAVYPCSESGRNMLFPVVTELVEVPHCPSIVDLRFLGSQPLGKVEQGLSRELCKGEWVHLGVAEAVGSRIVLTNNMVTIVVPLVKNCQLPLESPCRLSQRVASI